MTPTNDPMQRLAAYRTEIDEGVRERHLAQMGAALRTAPTTAVPTRLGFRRRFATALATLTIVVVPVGAAVAAEGSVPGDGLYPVKQVTERMRGWVDHDLVATHRVEELEVLLNRDADDELIAETADRAVGAVAALDDPGELGPRLDQAQQRIRLRTRQRIRGGVGSSSDSSGPVIAPGPAPGPGIGNPDSTGSDDAPGSGPGEPPEDADLDRVRDRDRDGNTGPDEDPPSNGDAPGSPSTDPPRSGDGDGSGGSGGSGGSDPGNGSQGNAAGQGGGSGSDDGRGQGKP